MSMCVCVCVCPVRGVMWRRGEHAWWHVKSYERVTTSESVWRRAKACDVRRQAKARDAMWGCLTTSENLLGTIEVDKMQFIQESGLERTAINLQVERLQERCQTSFCWQRQWEANELLLNCSIAPFHVSFLRRKHLQKLWLIKRGNTQKIFQWRWLMNRSALSRALSLEH